MDYNVDLENELKNVPDADKRDYVVSAITAILETEISLDDLLEVHNYVNYLSDICALEADEDEVL